MLEVANGALGECAVTRVTTDVHGKAVFRYTPLRPGANSVSVSASGTSVVLPIKQGGIWLQQQPSAAADIPADGKSASSLLIRCTDPDGRPMSGVRLSATLDERGLVKKGTLKPMTTWVSDSQGAVRCTYTPPDLRAVSSFRFANVFVSVKASPGTPPTAVSTGLRLRIVQKEMPTASATVLTLSVRHAQVLELEQCRQWVAGKPAVLRARVTWDNPTVETVTCTVTFRWNKQQIQSMPFTFKKQYSRQELSERRDTAWTTVSPGQAGDCEAGVRLDDVRITHAGGVTEPGAAVERLEAVTVRPSERQLRVLFVPVAIGSWNGRERMDIASFDSLRREQMRYARGMFPLPPSAVQDITRSNLMYIPEQALNEPVISEGSLLARIKALAAEYPGAYVLGVVPDDWLRHAGTSARDRVPHSMLISVNSAGGAMDTVLTHEWMHLLGFDHNTVTTDASPGVWIRDASTGDIMDMLREPGADFWDVMNIDPATSAQTWIGRHNYERLLRILLPN